jgi:hypothetical protein
MVKIQEELCMEELCVEELCCGRIVLCKNCAWKNCVWKNCVWKNCVWKNCGRPDSDHSDSLPYSDTIESAAQIVEGSGEYKGDGVECSKVNIEDITLPEGKSFGSN